MKRTAFSPHDNVYLNFVKCEREHNMKVQHYHDKYEMYFQLAGERYFFYDNICYTLKRGDFAVLMPFNIHYSQSGENPYYERYVLNFGENILKKNLNSEEMYHLLEKIKPCVIHLNEEQTLTMYEYFKAADNAVKKRGFLCEKILSFKILELILYVIECIDGQSVVEGKTIPDPIINVIKYINKNYSRNLTLDEIAEISCMSKFHFCRKFKEITGATVFGYLNDVRLTKVHSLLLHTKMSIEEIAHNTGFVTAAQMVYAFKKIYKISPGMFRKQNNIK